MTQPNKFRATYGLDAAGEKVINVATADRTVLTDGVNVDYFYQENTIQEFKPDRTYPKGFAVISNNRIWTAKNPIAAGPFVEIQWTALRSDPKWIPMSTGVRQLESGNYVTVDTEIGSPMELTLPSNAQDGDTIVVKDIGGRPGFVDVTIKAGAQSIYDRGNKLIQVKMTVPYSEFVFVYVNRLWNLYNGSEEPVAKFANTSGVHDVQASDTVVRKYDRHSPISIRFPKNANNGDIIHFVGMNTVNDLEPYYHLNLATYDNATSIFEQGTKSKTIFRSLSGYFVFEALTNTWLLFDSDTTNRLRTVSVDTNLFPNETVSVVGQNNTDVSTINLTLPQNVDSGAQITVALNYMRKGQTVNIVTKSPDMILTNQTLMQFPKRSDYPPNANWVNTNKLTFNGSTSYPPIITFAYIPMGPPNAPPTLGQWMVVENTPQIERVDPLNPNRLGVIAIATQAQANVDKGAIVAESKELAITAETLANRVATETREGIARIGTFDENQYPTDDPRYDDKIIVTPKKLNQKQAREDMRGLAEIATQDEANGSTDDQRIITSLKLDKRRANPDMAGVAPVVRMGGVAPTKNGTNTRDTAGTGIYDHADYSKIVTPKTLREFRATELAMGIAYTATSAEVIAGTDAGALYPLMVTPSMLHTKTATDGRIGFSQVATQTEVNTGTDYFKFVTPKTLNDRIASETLTGIARYATQGEFDNGNSKLISEPSKIKAFFDRTVRAKVEPLSGLRQNGTIWTTLELDIVLPTETQRGTTHVAKQDEVDAGVDDVKFVTAKKLQAKKATNTAEGIIQLATSEETAVGTVANKAVTPATLINAVQKDVRWESTNVLRGTVKLSDGIITFEGNDLVGSTKPLADYVKTGYAISPYELNKTLANYMPRKAKAYDSDLLDGLDSTQFVRRDIDQTVDGNITFTKNTTTNGNTVVLGTSTIGKDKDGAYNVDKIRLSIKPPQHGGIWNHATFDNTNDAFYKIMYNDQLIAQFKHTGETTLQTLVVGGLTSTNTLSVAQRADFANTIVMANKLAVSSSNNTLVFGSKTIETEIQTLDSGTMKSSDNSGSYVILTEKNYATIGDRTFVKKSGDTMSGRLKINAPLTVTITEANAATAKPTANNFGTWVVDIKSSANYNVLPGYVVPIMDKNSETGQETGFISHYEEFHGPGTLSQFGSSDAAGNGIYQIWAPRPTVTTDNHQAQTFWMRSWNVVKDQWDGFGRVYTSNNPPTASELGAVSDNGSVVSSLKIRDYIIIGNVKLYADPVSRSLKAEWIV